MGGYNKNEKVNNRSKEHDVSKIEEMRVPLWVELLIIPGVLLILTLLTLGIALVLIWAASDGDVSWRFGSGLVACGLVWVITNGYFVFFLREPSVRQTYVRVFKTYKLFPTWIKRQQVKLKGKKHVLNWGYLIWFILFNITIFSILKLAMV